MAKNLSLTYFELVQSVVLTLHVPRRAKLSYVQIIPQHGLGAQQGPCHGPGTEMIDLQNVGKVYI